MSATSIDETRFTPVPQRFGDALRIERRSAIVGRREEPLDVPDLLPRQVARHGLANERVIVVLTQVADHPHPHLQEAAEIAIDEGALQILTRLDRWVAPVLRDQLP